MPISRAAKWLAIIALVVYGAYLAARYLILRDMPLAWLVAPVAALAGTLTLIAYARRTANRPAVLVLAILMALAGMPIALRIGVALGISVFSLWMYVVSGAVLFATSFLAQAALLDPRPWTIAAAPVALSGFACAMSGTEPSASDMIAFAIAFAIAYAGARSYDVARSIAGR